jgi:hypothetical protein
MYGAANGVAAVEGSVTATGDSGFTFGVISVNLLPITVVVYSALLRGGRRRSDRRIHWSYRHWSGGEDVEWRGLLPLRVTLLRTAPAVAGSRLRSSLTGPLLLIPFIHCFNSTLPGSTSHTPPCGFNLVEEKFGVYWIDFGFEVDDRFWSVSAQAFYKSGIEAGLEAIIANANAADPKYAGNNSTIKVDLYKNGGSTQTTNFTLVSCLCGVREQLTSTRRKSV